MKNSQGIISAAYLKDASDPQWNNDPGMKEFYAFMAKDFSGGRQARWRDGRRLMASRKPLVQVLKQCGDNLTRGKRHEGRAASLKDFRTEVLPARHQDQYRPGRLCPDQPASADAGSRARNGSCFGERYQRRRRGLNALSLLRSALMGSRENPRSMLRGFFFCRNRMDNSIPVKSNPVKQPPVKPMTDRRPSPARDLRPPPSPPAHPDVVLSAHLRPAPKRPGDLPCRRQGRRQQWPRARGAALP